MKKIVLLFSTLSVLFPINGSLSFYDGNKILGNIVSVNKENIFLIPEGLIATENISVPTVESLFLQNGIIMIENGVLKNMLIDGKYTPVFSETTSTEMSDDFEEIKMTSSDYFSINIIVGKPVYFRPSLLVDNKDPSSILNLGFGVTTPQFLFGPVNASIKAQLMTIGFDKNFKEKNEIATIKAINIAGFFNADLKPVLNFLPDNINLNINSGLNYSIGWEEEYSGGIGINVGGSLDYWLEGSPMAISLFGSGLMIPTTTNGPKTGFGNIGISFTLALQRND
tara:strand:- start:312 stop:1157 length:846 start_codon:yes stop_codon:yes gene_type:complete